VPRELPPHRDTHGLADDRSAAAAVGSGTADSRSTVRALWAAPSSFCS